MAAEGRYATREQTHAYRRGAIMGLTMAEAFVIIAFILLFLLAAWRVQTEAENALYRDLPREELSRLREISENGLVDKVLDFQSDPDAWRLIDRDELVRVLDKAEDFPEDMQRDLADLVEIVEPIILKEILAEAKRAPAAAVLKERLASMGARFESAREKEAALVESLRNRLGEEVREIGGTIAGDGSIVLPEGVSFETNSAVITSDMEEFLNVICEPWLDVLRRSPAPISGARIEGHASREWGNLSGDAAFLKNLRLSQERAAEVLKTCLGILQDPENLFWAHRFISAVGYSSSRPVLDQGREDAERSRRVVFSVDVDDSTLLEEVERDISEGLGQETLIVSAPATDTAIVGRASVIDGDTIEIRSKRIRLHGIDAPESAQTCRRGGALERCGAAAAFALADFIGGSALRCIETDRDRYGRIVAICSTGTTDIARWMVQEGHALAYRQYSEDYVGAEDEARRMQRGIWGTEFEKPWEWRRSR